MVIVDRNTDGITSLLKRTLGALQNHRADRRTTHQTTLVDLSIRSAISQRVLIVCENLIGLFESLPKRPWRQWID